jgi:hypothetical protein
MPGLREAYGKLIDLVSGAYAWGAIIQHEPLSAPDAPGVICCIFPADPVAPLAESSGLAAADARMPVMVRLMRNALAEPQDQRETDLIDAYDALMTAMLGAFTVNGTVRAIDVLGESGEALAGQWGYISLDKPIFRIIDITVPLMINNAWTYGA